MPTFQIVGYQGEIKRMMTIERLSILPQDIPRQYKAAKALDYNFYFILFMEQT